MQRYLTIGLLSWIVFCAAIENFHEFFQIDSRSFQLWYSSSYSVILNILMTKVPFEEVPVTKVRVRKVPTPFFPAKFPVRAFPELKTYYTYSPSSCSGESEFRTTLQAKVKGTVQRDGRGILRKQEKNCKFLGLRTGKL